MQARVRGRRPFDLQLFAHKTSSGSSRNGRDSNAKRLGVKQFGGALVRPGAVILRQRGTRFFAGEGSGLGRDHTIFALREGRVVFRGRTVHVVPVASAS